MLQASGAGGTEAESGGDPPGSVFAQFLEN